MWYDARPLEDGEECDHILGIGDDGDRPPHDTLETLSGALLKTGGFDYEPFFFCPRCGSDLAEHHERVIESALDGSAFWGCVYEDIDKWVREPKRDAMRKLASKVGKSFGYRSTDAHALAEEMIAKHDRARREFLERFRRDIDDLKSE